MPYEGRSGRGTGGGGARECFAPGRYLIQVIERQLEEFEGKAWIREARKTSKSLGTRSGPEGRRTEEDLF